jgi:hypothetical protein
MVAASMCSWSYDLVTTIVYGLTGLFRERRGRSPLVGFELVVDLDFNLTQIRLTRHLANHILNVGRLG